MATVGWIVLAVLLGLLGLVVLLAAALLFVPITFTLSFRESLLIRMRILGVPITLYPRPAEPAKKPSARSPRAKKAQTEAEKTERKLKLGLSGLSEGLADVIAILSDTASAVHRSLTLRRLELDVTAGGEDAAEVALNYGKWCAMLFPAVGQVTSIIRTRRQSVTVNPDFLSEQSSYRAYVCISVTAWRIAGSAVRSLFRILRLTSLSGKTTTPAKSVKTNL